MKIRMLQSQYGPGISRNPGDEIEVPNDEAKRMIEGALAVPVRGSGSVETTSGKPSKKSKKS